MNNNNKISSLAIWDQFLVQKAAAAVLADVSHVLHIVDKPSQNVVKCTILKAKVHKFSGVGSQPSLQTPHLTSIVACGHSIWIP